MRARLSREQAVELLEAQRVRLAELGVASLALFGSTARGEAKAGSDVDIMVEFAGPATYGRFMDLKEFLEGVLGRPVDLVTRKALKPRMLGVVEEQAVYVAR